MDKLQVLNDQDERDEKRFKETMEHRNRILTMMEEIENMNKQAKSLQQEVKMMESDVTKGEKNIKLLETSTEALSKNIKKIMEKTLKDENELKKRKESYSNFLRAKIQQAQELLKENRTQPIAAVSEDQLKEAEETEATKSRVWALQGEVEALKIIEGHQIKKIEEIDCIVSVVEEPAGGQMEENQSENVQNTPSECKGI